MPKVLRQGSRNKISEHEVIFNSYGTMISNLYQQVCQAKVAIPFHYFGNKVAIFMYFTEQAGCILSENDNCGPKLWDVKAEFSEKSF